MKVLCVEDDKIIINTLVALLKKWDYEPIQAESGDEAIKILSTQNPPKLILTDWLMPKMTGIELIKSIRKQEKTSPSYIIILSSMSEKTNIIEGLESGANDYIIKPFDSDELKCRLSIGRRTLGLQEDLEAKIRELNSAIDTIKTLEGLLPICMYCKKIRTDDNYWEQIESYIEKRSDARFTHGICTECFNNLMKENAVKKIKEEEII